jgi:hypothetical protein
MDEVIKQLERANQYWDEYYDMLEARYEKLVELLNGEDYAD